MIEWALSRCERSAVCGQRFERWAFRV